MNINVHKYRRLEDGCSVLQFVVLHCVAVCCSSLQCVAAAKTQGCLQCVAVCCSALQCVTVCCNALQQVAVAKT